MAQTELKESDVECSRNVSFDKDVFKHVNVEETGVGAVKFLKPLNLECNYFECEIISTGIHDSVGIGVGEYEYPLDKMPGWLRKGVGYHDDGYIFNEGNAQDKLGPTCTKGDKMGCGVEFIDDAEYVIVFFTKNGEQIGDVILFNIPTSGLYSLIGMYNEGEQVRYLGHSQRGLPINLLKAVEEENISEVKEWINEHQDQPNKSTLTEAFHKACSKGLTSIIKILLKYEEKFKLIESHNKEQETALHSAIRNNSFDVIPLLLHRKKDAHLLRDIRGYTPLMIAAECGHLQSFEALLDHSANHCQVSAQTHKVTGKKGMKQKKKLPGKKLVASPTGEDFDDYDDEEEEEEDPQVDELIKKFYALRDKQAKDQQDSKLSPPEQEEIEMLEQTEITIEHSGDSSVVKTKSKTDSSHRTKDEAETMHYDTAASLLVASSKKSSVDAPKLKHRAGTRVYHIESDMGTKTASLRPRKADDSENAIITFMEQNLDMFAMSHSKSKKEGNQTNIMHLAAKNGHVGIVKKLWEHSKEACIVLLTRKDADGNIPLHLACLKGKNEIADEFLKIIKKTEVPELAKRFQVPLDEDDVCATLILVKNDNDDSPAHLACLYGHQAIVITLIKSVKKSIVEIKNKDEQTMMHLAAAGGHVEVLKTLTNEHAKIHVKNKNLETPLHLAAKNGHKAAVEYLMKSHSTSYKEERDNLWSLSFRPTVTCLDAAIKEGHRDVVEVILKNSKDWTDDDIFSNKTLRLLVEKMPDVAECVLNSCIKSKNWTTAYGSPQCKVEFHFDLLKGHSQDGSSRNKLLRALSAHKRDELIKHPLVQGMIDAIWKKYKYLFYFSLLLHVFFVALLTSLALLVNNPTSEICQSIRSGQFGNFSSELFNVSEQANVMVDENVTIADDIANIGRQALCSNETLRDALAVITSVEIVCGECGIKNMNMMFIVAAAVIIILISIIRLILELYQMLKSLIYPYQHRLEYFFDLANWLEVLVYSFALIFASAHLSSTCTCIQDREWSIGTLGVFIAWTSLVIYMRKLEFLDTGIYVLMFEILLKRFVKVIILTGLLVLTFSLAFYLTFNQLDPLFRASPFASPLNSIWKTMTMMTGELDYESIFRQASGGSDTQIPGLPFPELSYILWVLFLVLMPILLNNLLVGLAVDDIKGILETAEVTKIESKIDLIISLDNFRVVFVVFCCLPCLCTDTCTDCIQYVYKSLDIDNTSVHPFKKRRYFWFQQEKKYKSPQVLSSIIEPPAKENLVEQQEKLLQQHMESIKEAVDQVVKEKLEAMKHSMEDLYEEYRGRTVTEI